MASGPTIVAKFIADTSAMTSEVDKAASGASSRLESFATKAAVAIGGAFAVSKVVEFGKASVDAAAADAEAAALLASTLKNVTGATDAQVAASEAFISNLSKQAAVADDDLRPAMGNLVRGFGDAEQAQQALALATDVSAGSGKSLESVSTALMKAAQRGSAQGAAGSATTARVVFDFLSVLAGDDRPSADGIVPGSSAANVGNVDAAALPVPDCCTRSSIVLRRQRRAALRGRVETV